MIPWPRARIPVCRIALPATAVLVLVTLLAYIPLRQAGFVALDDPYYIFENGHVHHGLTWEGWRWAWSQAGMANWHPLTWLSHMLDVSLFGLDPGAHHLTSLGLHLANVALLMAWLYRSTGALWPAVFVTAVFAVHPLHVESVAWISERKDVLSTFWALAALLAYIRYARRPGWGRYLLVMGAFSLSLTAKAMQVTLPLVLLLIDRWPLGRLRADGGLRAALPLILEKAPLLVLSLTVCFVTYHTQQAGGAVRTLAEVPLDLRLANALVSYTAYLAKAIWPVGLGPQYAYPQWIPVWRYTGAGLLLTLWAVVSLRTARRFPFFAVGFLWYVGTLLPVIGLVQVGSQPLADRYTYWPLVGPSLAVAYGVTAFGPRRSMTRAAPVAVALTVILMAAATHRQLGFWQDSARLFQRLVDTHRAGDARTHNRLGTALDRLGRPVEAVAALQRAAALRPDWATPHYNLGNLLAAAGRLAEAEAAYGRALALRPDDADARHNLAVVLMRSGRPGEAVAHFRRVLHQRPRDAAAVGHLGAALLATGKLDAAVDALLQAVRLSDSVQWLRNLGVALMNAGRNKEAAVYLLRVVERAPADREARRYLEQVLRRSASETAEG